MSLSDWHIGICCNSLVSCLKFFVINFKSLKYCLFLFVNPVKCVEELLSTWKETEKKENLHESEEYFWLFLNLNFFIQYILLCSFPSAAPPRLPHLSSNPIVCSYPPFSTKTNKNPQTKIKTTKDRQKKQKWNKNSQQNALCFLCSPRTGHGACPGVWLMYPVAPPFDKTLPAGVNDKWLLH